MTEFSFESIPGTESNEKLDLEQLTKQGDEYVTFVKYHLPHEDQTDSSYEIPPFLESLGEAVSKHQQTQEQFIQIIGVDNILVTAGLDEPTKEKIRQEIIPEIIETKKLSEGIYGIVLLRKQYDRLDSGRGTRGMAFIPKQGLSFILIPQESLDGTELPGKEQTIQHELQHIIWGFARKEQLVTTSETESDWINAFRIFQDEVLARLVAGERPMGYPGQGVDFINTKMTIPVPEIILQNNGVFNHLLREAHDLLLRKGKNPTCLIPLIIQSKSFANIGQKLKTLTEILEELPDGEKYTQEDSPSPSGLEGWGEL